jgi:hypothetical protein
MIGTALAATLIAAATFTPASSDAWICNELDRLPSVGTVENIVYELISDGYTADSGSEYLVKSVAYGCPRHWGLLEDFVEKWG